MAHYECSICGETLCTDSKCTAEKQRLAEEYRQKLGSAVTEINPIKENPMETKTEASQIANSHAIQIQLLHPDAKVPELGTVTAAGYDLYAVEDVGFEEDDIKAVPLGFATALPVDIHGRIESRSGMALKGFVVLTGVIDADYRGEWKVILSNYWGEKRSIKKGDRIAQVVLRPTIHRRFDLVDTLSNTERGAGGFGSTGR